MNSSMPTIWTTYEKWINFQKYTIFKAELGIENLNTSITSSEIELVIKSS